MRRQAWVLLAMYNLIHLFGHLISCKSRIRIETILQGRATGPVNTTLLDDIPIFGARGLFGLSDMIATGELMPFSPLNGCSQLEPSLFTKNFTQHGAPCVFDPFIGGNRVIALMQQMGPCSLENKIRQASRTEGLAGLVIIHKDEDLPNDIDIDLLGSRIPVVMLRYATGKALIELAHWYREAALKSSAIFLKNREKGQLNPNLSLPDLSDDNNEIVFHNLTDSKHPTPKEDEKVGLLSDDSVPWEDTMWLKATLIFDDEVDHLGVVEFSLIVVVVLLGTAFITSIGLHCYFYRFRRNPTAATSNTAASVAGQTVEDRTRTSPLLIDQDKLLLFPIFSYSQFCQVHEQLVSPSKVIAIEVDSAEPKEQSLGVESFWRGHYGPPLLNLNDTCPICLDDFEEKDLLRELPCFHLYHPECIDEWLTRKAANCPQCKFDVFLAIEKRLKEGPSSKTTKQVSPLVTTAPLDQTQNVSALGKWKTVWRYLKRKAFMWSSATRPTLEN